MNIINTKQTTHFFSFKPVEGWNDNGEYSTADYDIVQECTKRIDPALLIIRHHNNYFKFLFEYHSTDGSTKTKEIEDAIRILKEVCEEFALEFIGTEL